MDILIGFKKPAVVRFKNPTSTAFRVSWHATPIRVKKKLENLPQYVHKWTCMGKCTLGAHKVYTQAAGAVSVQYVLLGMYCRIRFCLGFSFYGYILKLENVFFYLGLG